MHTRFAIHLLSAVMVAGVLFVGSAAAQNGVAESSGDYTTVWNGIFTPDQALRGQEAFDLHCMRCHQSDIDAGNPDARFRGHMFMERWREYDLESLYDFIRLTMPRRDPGKFDRRHVRRHRGPRPDGERFPSGPRGTRHGRAPEHSDRREGWAQTVAERCTGPIGRLPEPGRQVEPGS